LNSDFSPCSLLFFLTFVNHRWTQIECFVCLFFVFK
jgi:hypothetical protein